MPELIARETDDNKTAFFILLVKFFKPCKLWGESTLACCIHYEKGFSFELVEIQFLSCTCERLEIIY